MTNKVNSSTILPTSIPESPKESFWQQHKVAILMIGGAALIIGGVALFILTNQGVGALSNCNPTPSLCGDIAYCSGLGSLALGIVSFVWGMYGRYI